MYEGEPLGIPYSIASIKSKQTKSACDQGSFHLVFRAENVMEHLHDTDFFL